MSKCSECGFNAAEVFQHLHERLMEEATTWAMGSDTDPLNDSQRGQVIGILTSWYILACELQLPARAHVYEEYRSMLFSSRRE